MSFSRIRLIGFGEVGQILAEDLNGADIAAFDLLFADAESIPSRALGAHRVRAGRDAADAVRGGELVISAVTAAETVNAARAAAPGIDAGAFYLDLNSASPGAKRAAGAFVDGAGGRYVEAAVMTSYPAKRIASPMLLGGPYAEEFLKEARGLGFQAEVCSAEIGKASATKMCRSVIIKGVEALLAESLLTARRSGVEGAVLASLGDLLPAEDWPKLARYMIARSLAHGRRRAEEMREAARTVAETGIAPLMSEAIAERQDWTAGRADAELELGALLDAILKSIDSNEAVGARENVG
jgi:3-hydroxyisobutyrate dehydrogenase-like beta-hydroxyacid dehydrogenase